MLTYALRESAGYAGIQHAGFAGHDVDVEDAFHREGVCHGQMDGTKADGKVGSDDEPALG